MKGVTATAPGKVILFGEHAVVYGRPALAAPVFGVQASATVEEAPAGSGLLIYAADLGLHLSLADAATHGPALAAHLALEYLKAPEPDAQITLRSTIPIAGGMGSGAAVSAALIRALCDYLGHPIEDAALSALVYEVEKFYHGTPSGIDNTVICYGKPVYYIKGHEPCLLQVGQPFDLLIGDTGIATPTRMTVGAVREAWQRDLQTYERLFDAIGAIAREARSAIERGDVQLLGPLITRNHALLRELGVSSPELEQLVRAALEAGAAGAKLSGGGGGGNMIALVEPTNLERVSAALRKAGAVRVLHTLIR